MNFHRLLDSNVSSQINQDLNQNGYTFIRAKDYRLTPSYQEFLSSYREEYRDFPVDNHLNGGEGLRTRRYARFQLEPKSGELRILPHDTFFQSADFDELYGDIHRHFAPLNQQLLNNSFFLDLIRDDFYTFPVEQENTDCLWEISTHLIRIASVPGNAKGRPAPEGIHQDGYHFGVARLFDLNNISGAESRVHNLDKEIIDRTHLVDPLDALYMNDRAIYHSVEPFGAADPSKPGHRDVLISLYQPLGESPQPKAESLALNLAGIREYLYE